MKKSFSPPTIHEVIQEREVILSHYDNHIVRRLSAMNAYYLDEEAYQAMMEVDDFPIYRVYEVLHPEKEGELRYGITIVHPGKVGSEYFMTKGHFHTVLDTAEVYYCLQGEGFMVMENPEGDWAVEPLRAHSVLYVPPRWAHRSVNTSPTENLVMFFVYPGNAGHNYGSIEEQGFRKLVLEQEGDPKIVDNPRWLAPESR